MLFWLICALMVVVVILLILRPVFMRNQTGANDTIADLQVYKDQLEEVEKDLNRGLLSPEEANSARIEVSRRILALSPETADSVFSGVTEQAAGTRYRTVFSATAVLVVACTLGLYLAYGSPGYSGRPYAERASLAPQSAPVEELIARVEARLREVPNDGQGWDVLAPVYAKQGRTEDAIRAYSRAIDLLGENRSRLRGLAEAYLAATNGIVVEQARDAFQKLLKKEPELIAPRFWLAVGMEQDGDVAGATAAYRALLGSNGKPVLPPALEQLVRERLAAVTGAETPKMPATSEAPGKVPSPSPEAFEAAKGQPTTEMIEGMVAGLAERLDANGGSPEEWRRLIRAYWVLGRREDAVATLMRAKKQLAATDGEAAKLDQFAQELGLRVAQ
ncbi:MAG: c-type cytochrome biogenesis protein CcmI [Alphaproteobacteria bacterium]|nr:c-type cytochrome biogenesis protein CcmI [Alphaproteobacteria bacterium]